jgi:hypothetical protein
MAPNRGRVPLVSFITGSVLAGGNAVGVRFSNRELAPLWGAGLTSRTVRDLVVGSDIVLEDRGAQRLRGVEGRWQLYAVARP